MQHEMFVMLLYCFFGQLFAIKPVTSFICLLSILYYWELGRCRVGAGLGAQNIYESTHL